MRVSIKFLLSSILFLSSWFCAPNLWADDFYWRKNPINGNFNDAANWSSTSTGAESGTDDVGRYPSTATDNVFFTTASSIVTLNQITGVVTIHNITCTAPAGTVYNLSTNTTYNINGSIQSNGNLTITNGTINMIGAENVTVDLGTSNPIAFGNTFTVNKANTPAQAKVTLINNDFKRTGSLSLQNGSFDNINNKNITATSTTFQRPDGTSDHITINLGASTLTLTSGQFTLHGKQLHPTCDVNLNDALKLTNTNYYGTDTIQFKSLTLGSAVRTMNISDNTVNLTLENLTVNTPSLTIISQDAGYFKTVNISDALTFNQPTDMIVNSMGGRPYGLAYYYSEYGNNTSTWNINDFVFPSTTDCTQRSSIIGFTPVTLNITGTALTTQNIIYKNITATGAGITASPTEDGGLNSGITFTGPATSKDYYWIGDTGNWDDPAHWKNNATGSSDGCIPSPIDNVFFDTNSFSATGQAATLRKPAFCKNISWVDAGKEGSLNVSDYSASMPSGNSLTIQGDADFSGAKVVQPGLYFLGAGDQTLNSGTDPVYMSPYIYFQAGAGTYTLTSDLIMSDASPAPYYKNPIIHTSGTLNSDGYTLDIGSFFSRLQLPAGSSRSINFTNSKIYVDIYGENSTLPSINLLNDGAGTYQFTGSQLFMNNTRPTAGNTDTRNLFRASGLFEFNDITFADGRRGRVVFDNANTKVRKLTFNGPVQASGNTSTCIVDSLILTPYKEYDFYTSTITITGGLDARTSGCQTITIGNPTSYVSTFVNNTTNEMSINGAIIKNTNYNAGESGYPQLQVPNGVDQGNNTNVNVTAAAPRDFYWVGGTGNWSDANHWSFTSGGPGNGTCLPALNDDVYFDQNSFSANNQVVTMDQALVTIHSMIWQPGAGTKTPVLALNSARLELYGSLELASGMQVNYGSIYFKGTGTGEDSQTIRTNNVSMPNTTLDFDSYGRFDLYGNLIVSYLYHRNGGFVTHNYNVTAPNTFWLSTTNGLPLDLGTSTLTGPFNWYIGNNGSSLNTADARLVSTTTQQARIVPNNQDIFFKSIVFNNRSGNLEGATSGSYAVHTEKLTFSPPADATSNSTINGNFVVDTLVISATAPFMKITQGRTLTINEETILENGTPCNYFYIQSTTLNSPAKIKFNHCNPTLYYVSLQDIDVDCSGATDCEEGVPNSELTVYGSAAAERVTGDVTITDPGRPAIINLAPVLSGCLPYNFLVPGKITSYDLVKKEGGTETTVITNGTARFIPIYESGDYRLDANYEGIDCEGIITQTITIKAYRTWTAMGRSNDWKDIANWDIDLLPDPCSYVIIPGGLRHYPVINKLDSAVCDIIDFKFGGEVKNTHLLTYNAAKVEMNLNSKQWYMLSAPLGDLYSGDFYVTDPNPFVDGYKIYAMLFNAENPQSHKTVEATWTGTFNTANQLLTKGTGMTIWAENEDVPQMTTNFTFPKPDASYNYYFGNGNVSGTTGPISRTNSSRFAYDEPGFDAAVTTKITLPFPTVRAGEAFMVGNPFMTHLDFEAFYNENQTSILNEYSVATGVSTFDPRAISPFSTYIVGGATTGPVVLTKDIAPMQSFIVKSKVNSPNLRADVEFHTETSSNTLRSSAEIYRPDYTLEITSEREQKPSSRILVSYAGNASPEYVPEEDSYTLFSSNSLTPVILYTRSADGYALNVNASNDLGRIVPLGIRTSQTGEIHLKFAGLESFKNEVKIYLHDTRLNRVMDLDATAEYVFNKEEEALYSEDRFFLSFRSATGIGQLNATTGLIVRRTAPLTIQVSSSDGSMLTHLQITNLQGQSPVRATNVPSGSTYRVHKPGVYIVRATGKDYTQVEKIVVY